MTAKDILNNNARASSILKELTTAESDKLKDLLVDMAYDLYTRCHLLGIDFCIAYGSALGAYRHHDVIPWDDDLDIVMMRDDWEVFKKHFNSYFSDKYELEAPNYMDKDCKVAWGKVFLKGTVFEEIYDIGTPFCKGIFIDIFVLDGIVDNILYRKVDYYVLSLLRAAGSSLIYYKYPNHLMRQFSSITLKSRLYFYVRIVIGFFASVIPHKRWCQWFDNYSKRHGDTKTYFTVTAGRFYKNIVKKDLYFPSKEMLVRGRLLPVPNKIEEHLEKMYGTDYNVIPPENKRERHFIVNLDFGDY